MTTVPEPQPTARTARAKLDAAAQLPIADLSPSRRDPDAHILAQVALVWPYSSSTGTLALLLADPDIRRRKSKGQAKVVFHNGCAGEVAKTKVGIGDTVKLALAGCEWKETGDVVSTPGKKIDWDLEYNTCVLLEVLRGDRDVTTVDFTGTEADVPTTNGASINIEREDHIRPKLNAILSDSSTIRIPYLTPKKSNGINPTGTFIDTALESSVEDDGYVLGRGRKRTKFARNSGAWSFVDLEAETPLEENRNGGLDDEDAAEVQRSQNDEVAPAAEPAAVGEVNHTEAQTAVDVSKEVVPQPTMVQVTKENMSGTSSPVRSSESISVSGASPPQVMGPPQTSRRVPPLVQPAMNSIDAFDNNDGSEAATTPRLLPIPSPGLPLVSPLVHRAGVEVGYFPPAYTIMSQLDASSEKEEEQAVPVTNTADNQDHTSLHFDEPSGDVSGKLGSEDAVKAHEATGDALADTMLVSRDSQEAAEDRESAKKAAYEAPQWLSSLESSIDRELLLSQDQLISHTVSQNPSRAIEVEDDDLYGAPIDTRRTNPSLAASPPAEYPRSPLDVLERFLQISPTAAVGFSPPLRLDGWQNTQNTSIPQDAAQGVAEEIPQDGTAVSTTSNQSPGTYPESQSPFRHNRHHLANPIDSTRPHLGQASSTQSLDGHSDEQESFKEYIDHLAQFSANSQASEQPVPDPEPSHDEMQNETQVEADVSVTTIMVDVNTHVETLEHVTEESKHVTDHSEAANVVKEESQQLISAVGDKETGVESVLLSHVHIYDARGQLPTPDQSQVQRSSTEPETPTLVQESLEVGFPSPQHTQEEIDGDSEEPVLAIRKEKSQVVWEDPQPIEVVRSEASLAAQEERAGAQQEDSSQELQKESPIQEPPLEQRTKVSSSPAFTTPISTSHQDPATPRRSSQRLSARKSIMAEISSSPYVKPGKSTEQSVSSPPRKENINPAEGDSALLPSPKLGQVEAPLLSVGLQEAKQATHDMKSVSRPLRTNGLVYSEDSGITTPLAYFTPLRSLHEQFGQLVDVIAVCADSSSEPEQSKAGRKDYHTILQLSDPSLPSETPSVISAQVFRPVRTALPTVHSGDVVILRNFKVQTFHRQFRLVSNDTSSWAVFGARSDSAMALPEAVVSGPPLEYGDRETSRVKLLFDWWNESGKELFGIEPTITGQAKHQEVENSSSNPRSPLRAGDLPPPSRKVPPSTRRRNADPSDIFSEGREVLEAPGSSTAGTEARDHNKIDNSTDKNEVSPEQVSTTDSLQHDSETVSAPVKPLNRRRANETDNLGNEGDEDVAMVGDDWDQSIPLADKTNRRRGSTISTAPSEPGTSFTPRRSARLRKSPSLVHELRDGTKYVDDNRRRSASVVHELRDGATYVDE
ncbi:hypothetical protein AYO21_03140 [Fonsecaea monophora]|uniref:Telomeric single stranded DNA binding POT1/Cdc13 domain-containing protein n=1 Tax=Fonsecaea monophora TaxID=254056 RepID=A0A177FE74_9EURO|nr:hypothetical protein AYO21_03140 [Fonsecaea monophora]KAH0841882.1 hypothetical protein FOPE_06623 [Fonsecaea pedrosoi]OAG42555.1 hypothetical protein AYO21_03140 [Fonsecaea monophora]